MVALDLWRTPRLDPYRLLRPLFFRMDPEDAHSLSIKLLTHGLGPRSKPPDDAILNITVCGLALGNPIGLAAGFDKNGDVINEMLRFGFGFEEIGTITPRPQTGNPKPRLFRITEADAAINRLGFNSDGIDACVRRIAAWYDSTQPYRGATVQRGAIGINIGINKDCENPVEDYTASYKKVAPYAGYVTINISSPNTPGLRDLQHREHLSGLLGAVMSMRESCAAKPPVFVKIAPDLNDAQAADIAETALTSGIQGMIVGNTTVSRPATMPMGTGKETGGLSGKPLFSLSTAVLAQMYKLTGGKIPLIGCGGVSSGADAYAKIRAGASLVQLYTALIYQGPGIVAAIKRDLAALLRKDGFKSVIEAVGTGNP